MVGRLDAWLPVSGQVAFFEAPLDDVVRALQAQLAQWDGSTMEVVDGPFPETLRRLEPIDGRKRFRGRLEGFEDGEIRMLVDLGEAGGQKVIGLGIGLVSSARLVLTDELVREALSRAKRKSKTGLGDGSEADPTDVEED